MATKNNATKKKGATPKAADVETLIDKKLKARWQSAIARYQRAKSGEAEGWDDRFEALGEIIDSDPPLYLAGGYKNKRAFLRDNEPDLNERTLERSIRVARHFDPADEVAHGVARLDALLDYLEAVAGGKLEAPVKVSLDRQKVRVPEGTATRSLLFTKASAEQVRAATRFARSGKTAVAKGEAPLVTTVRALLAKVPGCKAVSVRLRAEKIDLGGIPVEGLSAVGRALGAAGLGGTRPR